MVVFGLVGGVIGSGSWSTVGLDCSVLALSLVVWLGVENGGIRLVFSLRDGGELIWVRPVMRVFDRETHCSTPDISHALSLVTRVSGVIDIVGATECKFIDSLSFESSLVSRLVR